MKIEALQNKNHGLAYRETVMCKLKEDFSKIDKMKKPFIYVLLMTIFLSCKKQEQQLPAHRAYKANENLISFDLSYNITHEEARMPNMSLMEFDPKFDTIEYKKDELYISYITLLVGCREFHGDIEVKEDSLILKLPNFGEVACTEAETARVKYRIKNPNNIKYKIKKARGI